MKSRAVMHQCDENCAVIGMQLTQTKSPMRQTWVTIYDSTNYRRINIHIVPNVEANRASRALP